MQQRDERARRRLSRPPRFGLITAVLALAGASAAFMQMIVVPIQSRLPELLDADRDATAWVVTVTLLTGAVFVPVVGRLADLYGKRRLALVLLGTLVVGSVVAALPWGLTGLLIGRGLQGIVYGIVPLGISILRDVLPPRRLPGGIALVSATLAVGGAIGLPVSALVSDHLDWHALFWVSAALGLLNFVLVLTLVPVSTLRSVGRFDLPGALGLSASLTALLLALTQGAEWGWSSPLTLGCLLGGLGLLTLWGWYELRSDSPLVDLRVAARPAVLLTNLASVFVSFAFFSANITLPQLLTLPAATGVGLGLDLLTASLILMPAGLLAVVASPLAARLSLRFGAQPLLAIGSAVILLAYLAGLLLLTEVWHVLLVNTLVGLGIGLGYAAMPTLIMNAVPASETGAANGLNALMRAIGTTSAAAVVGLVLAQASQPFGDVDVPTTEGFRLGLGIGAAAAAIALVLALIPHSRNEGERRPALP